MAEHICKCTECQPEAFPSGPPQAPDHIAIRFREQDAINYQAFLNGERVNACTEAKAGSDGFVVRYVDHGDGKVRTCQCRGGACAEVAYGSVTLTYVQPPPPPTDEELRQEAEELIDALRQEGHTFDWVRYGSDYIPDMNSNTTPMEPTGKSLELGANLLLVTNMLKERYRKRVLS